MTGAIEKVIAALNEAGVRYIVVGGVAVVLHGHLRVTAASIWWSSWRGATCCRRCVRWRSSATGRALIDLKLKAGRAVDLADVEALRAITDASEP